jgi:outer membrane receptor protein involved in Fe transport
MSRPYKKLGGFVLYKANKCTLLILVASLLMVIPLVALAGTTGKIAGTVVNKETGEPLPGATIRVIGTDLATQTDDDGEYFVINLPAGTYELSVTMIGFQSVQKQEIRVLLDLTTPVDFDINRVDIQLANQIKVRAERPAIQKDVTDSRYTLTSDRLEHLANTLSIQNILADMAGVIEDKNLNLHVRGGRNGSVSYLLDGFSVQDPIMGQVGIKIVPNALEEISLTSGGFTAEYGDALAGIVNAVTKEGTNKFQGKVRFYDGWTSPYNVTSGQLQSFQRVKNNGVGYDLSGPIPMLSKKRATFYIAGEYVHDNGYLPHNKSKSWGQMGKISIQPTPDLSLSLIGSFSSSEIQSYTHRDVNNRSYDFNLDGLPLTKTEAYLYGIKANYNINQKSIMTLQYGHFYTQYKRAPESLYDTYWSDWPGYSVDSNGVYNGTIHENNYQFTQDYFYTGFTAGEDFNPSYAKRYSKYDAVTFNLTSQYNKYNQLRFGGEYRKYDIFWDKKQFFNLRPYGEKYAQSPVYGMMFAQDKLELKDMIVTAGIRWDYLNSEVEYWSYVYDTANYPRVSSKPKAQLSPRLGMSYPVSENAVLRFSYGYFYQAPQYPYMYTNLQADLNTGYPLVGNPDLKSEKNIAYELGLNQMINSDLRFDVTLYFKDIKNLIASRRVRSIDGNNAVLLSPVTQYTNEDYGSVKGFDVTLEKISRGNMTGSLVYSYMIAKGNSSDANDGYYYYITAQSNNALPVKEFALSYDQRHSVTLNLDYRVPSDWRGHLFGLTVPGAWGINLVGTYGSGLPYTVTDNLGNQMGGINEGRMPSNYSVDFRFNKDIYLRGQNTFLSLFVEIDNLFNRRNILNVYSNTGLADYDGRYYEQTADPDGSGPYTAEDVNRLYRLMANDPQNFSSPRTMRVGMEINF